MQTRETIMNVSTFFQNQLLATKFHVPIASGTLISRPHLTALLNKSLGHPLTLISAPAGFGKTTLLSTWVQSLPASTPLMAWVSLDEEDNEPRLFWTSVLTALEMQQPERFAPLLMHLQSPQAPPLKYILTALINLLVETSQHFLLILDDYHLIAEQQIHTALSYLMEHLPPQLQIILSTRADPSLPLSLLRTRQQMLEIRTDQLRCTAEETGAFFKEVMDIQLPQETIQEVRTRTEGWLVSLQLLGLSLQERADPVTLLEEVSGDQRYILDYLTEEVLRRQPQDVQTFLLSTCIFERLTASLCDAVMQQTDSQQMLERLEQANLFIVPLDSRRQWYRYHMLFAEALHYQLEQTHADLLPTLHYRASLWYAEHDQITKAVLHAFSAHQWQWAADLIERIPLALLAWGVGEHELVLLRQWLEQLPIEVLSARPRLCLTSAQMLWAVTPHSTLEAWLDATEARLTASPITQTHGDELHPMLAPQAQQEQEDLLGGVFTTRAFLRSFQEDGQETLLLCQQAFTLLSAQNIVARVLATTTQCIAYYLSSANDAEAAVQSMLQAVSLAQTTGQTPLAINVMGTAAVHMLGTGRLHETQRLTRQAIQLGTQPRGLLLPEAGWPSVFRAEILREWNQLDAALSLAEEALSLCKQAESVASLIYPPYGYAVLLRIYLSRGELDAALSALQQLERIGKSMNQTFYLHVHSSFTTIDQIRLWLACGELKRATSWAETLDVGERHGTPFARERQEVARVRILLAKKQPAVALQRLEPLLQRATTAQRWDHVIEMQLLQARAHQMHQQETQALSALTEAVRLAKPEGYIRRFVDEGAPIADLLSQLREEQREGGLTTYLDTVLAAFPQQSKEHERQSKRTVECIIAQPLLDPLSEREMQVLQLLIHGASNQQIAQKLTIAVDTVKRHVSQIFSKLGVKNRVQAVRQARSLGMLDEGLNH